MSKIDLVLSSPSDSVSSCSYSSFDPEQTISNRFISSQIRDDLRDELLEIYSECKEPNWDGEGAFPVELETLKRAIEFLHCYPITSFPEPEFSVGSDGEIHVCWRMASFRNLCISVNALGRFAYSVFFNENRYDYGVCFFDGAFPETIFKILKKLCEE